MRELALYSREAVQGAIAERLHDGVLTCTVAELLDAIGGAIQANSPRAKFIDAVCAEVERAYAKHDRRPWSRHEFYGIIAEEFEEMWDEIKADAPRERLDKEITQVAAMCVRFMENRLDAPTHGEAS